MEDGSNVEWAGWMALGLVWTVDIVAVAVDRVSGVEGWEGELWAGRRMEGRGLWFREMVLMG